MISRFIEWLAAFLKWEAQPELSTLTMPLEAPKQPQDESSTLPKSDATRLYEAAKSCLGQHLTLNNNVPDELGCAEALSFILKKVGIAIPPAGIASTTELYNWLPKNGFTKVDTPQPGDIIISPTGMGNGSVRGHVGIIANYGILSNDSATGLFRENWQLQEWKDWYHGKGDLPVVFYRWG